MQNNILRLPQVMVKTGLCRTAIYAAMNADEFPQSIPLGKRSVGWLEAEIELWIKDRADSRKAA